MEVAHIGFCTGHGGDITAIKSWAWGQIRGGHHVRLLHPFTEHSDLLIRRCAEQKIPVTVLHDVPLQDRAKPPLRIFRLLRQLLKARADVLHIHGGEAALRTTDLTAIRLFRRLSPQTLCVATPHGREWGTNRAKIAWLNTMRSPDGIQGIISTSRYAMGIQTEAGVEPSRIVIVHTSIDPTPFIQSDRKSLRDELSLRDDQPLVLFFARLDPVKRPLEAMEAFIRIAPEFPDAVFAMAGNGDLEDTCRARAEASGVKDRILFLGYRTDVANCLAGADIYFVPTEWENFSNAILEAMATGLPIITTPVGGNLEALTDGETARIVAVGDVTQMADALRSFLRSPTDRQQFGQQARERVIAEFSTDAVAKKLMSAYRGWADAGQRKRLFHTT